MLHVNFKAYSSYVTESLYQWDINQRLNITGLELTTAPEVHFANANMERAIVRESTISNGTITVTIPNSLLQAPLPIMAYIGIYEGETFKVIESVKIPVIPKQKPTDYVFVDDGGDIYSYNEILHTVTEFEKKYGAVDLDAIRDYEQWVNDVRELETRVTPIELGGTGATTPEEACVNLGVATYQKPWDVDENVDDIVTNTMSMTSNAGDTTVFNIKMINSGSLYVHFLGNYSSQNFTSITITVSVNDTIFKTFTKDDLQYYNGGSFENGKSCDTLINVTKGDNLTITVNSTYSGSDFPYVFLNKLSLLANIDTPYKYISLDSTAITSTDVLDTLLGV